MVYFVQSAQTKHIKIGYSRTVNGSITRWRSLQTGNSDKLELLAIMDDDGTRRLEKSIHLEYRELRIIGEWFRCSNELIAFIDSAKFIGIKECLGAAKEEIRHKEKPIPLIIISEVKELKHPTLPVTHRRSEIPTIMYGGRPTKMIDHERISRLRKEAEIRSMRLKGKKIIKYSSKLDQFLKRHLKMTKEEEDRIKEIYHQYNLLDGD